MEWHGAIAIYVIGTLALIISAVHTAVTSQETGEGIHTRLQGRS